MWVNMPMWAVIWLQPIIKSGVDIGVWQKQNAEIIEQAMHSQLWRITLELCDSQLILSLTIHACRSFKNYEH